MNTDTMNTIHNSVTTTTIDQEVINQFYDGLDFNYESENFILEQQLADMQPNSSFGMLVVNKKFRNEDAVIVETFKDDGYCIGRFINGNGNYGNDIYIPAQPNTYNSFLEKDMKVTVGAYNTPGLIYHWRSKFVNIPNEIWTFIIKTNSPNSAGLIIGPGGSHIENIKENSKKNYLAKKPKITIINKERFIIRVEVIGETNLIDIEYIKDQIMAIYYGNGIDIEIE